MKTTLKKVLSMALALVLLVGVLPMSALATTDTGTVEVQVWLNNTTDGSTFWTTPGKDANGVYDDYLNSNIMRQNTEGPIVTTTDGTRLEGTTQADTKYYLWLTWSESCAHNWDDADCDTPKTCSLCGATEGEALGHDWSEEWISGNFSGNGATSTAGHWHECSRCSDKKDEAEHVFNSWNHNETTHWYECVCGEKSNVANHVAINTEWQKNDTHHWKTCACGGKAEYAQHVWEDVAKSTTQQKCKCGAEKNITVNSNGSTGGTTSNIYTVFYNVNVNASQNNEFVGSYASGATMGEALDKLSTMPITRPGLYPTWFKLAGWYMDRACTNPVTRNTLITEDTVVYAKWERKYNYEVTLKLYTNGNTNTVVKVVDAFAYIQDDGILSNSEVTAIAKQYIESNNNAPITAYGPFESGSEWDNFCKYQNRYSTKDQYLAVDDPAAVVHVMVHNAKINNSSSTGKKADSSNPKTGDMIMVPAAVMGTTVSALAVMFYLKKKRTV